jgi:hypothetical protein
LTKLNTELLCVTAAGFLAFFRNVLFGRKL